MSDTKETRVIVIKNGLAKELTNLPEEMIRELEEAYENEPIHGLSRETYLALADFFSYKLKIYKEEWERMRPDEYDVATKSVAFANAFDISSEESPYLFDMMLAIERRMAEGKGFSSRDISMRNMKNLIGTDWFRANKDFRNWARRLFEETGLRIGIIRMSKFFYGVASQLEPEII